MEHPSNPSDEPQLTSPASVPNEDWLKAIAQAPDCYLPGHLEVGTIVDDDFRIERPLGAGGMGVVYLARDLRLHREVALKVHQTSASAGRQERLMREAKAMARLAHPNVITVYDVGTVGGCLFIAMEYVDGCTARRWNENADRSWREIVTLYCAAARGIWAAHQVGIVHRDFKPDNVLIGTDGRVRVADFGLAKQGSEADPVGTNTETTRETNEAAEGLVTTVGGLSGTPAYMAPEQFDGTPIDPRADQFAFGVALYEALYGKRPFTAATPIGLHANYIAGRTPDFPTGTDTPRHIESIVRRCLAINPADRFSSMGQVVDALERDPAHRRRRVVGGGIVVVSLAAGAGGLLYGHDSGSRPCDYIADKLEPHWNPARAEQLKRRLTQAEASYTEQSWQHVKSTLDRYAERWTTGHTHACQAALIHSQRTPEFFERQLQCYEDRRVMFAAVVDAFEAAGPLRISEAPRRLARLEEVRLCDVRSYVMAGTVAPSDPGLRAQIAELREKLASALAAENEESRVDRAQALLDEARELDEPQLIARAQYLLGSRQFHTQQLAQAEKNLTEAYFSAKQHGPASIVLDALASMIWVSGYQGERFGEAEIWVQHAKNEVKLLGLEPGEHMKASHAIGVFRDVQGRYEAAHHHYDAALEHALANNKLSTAVTIMNSKGATFDAQGRHADAEREYRRAVEIVQTALGPDHPLLSLIYGNLGLALGSQGKHQEALETFELDLQLARRDVGENALDTGYAWLNLGTGQNDLMRFSEALESFNRAAKIIAANLGDKHSGYANALTSAAVAYQNLGQRTKALEYLDQALEIALDVYGDKHIQTAMVRANRALVLRQLEHSRDALVEFEAAVAVLDELAPQSAHATFARTELGNTLIAAGRANDAVSLLRSAMKQAAPETAPGAVAELKFVLAQALWNDNEERPAATRLATDAAKTLRELGGHHLPTAKTVQAWLTAHSTPVVARGSEGPAGRASSG